MRSNQSENSEWPSRRKIMKSIGVVGAASIGSFSTTAAADTNTEIDQSTINNIFNNYASETVEIVASAGLIEQPSFNEFPLEKRVSMDEQFETGEGTTVLSEDMPGIPRNAVETSTQVEGGIVKIVAETDEKRSYALYFPNDSSSEYVYDPELQDSEDVSTQSSDSLSLRSDGSLELTSQSGDQVSVNSSSLCTEFTDGWQGEDCHRCTSRKCSDAQYPTANYIKRETECPTRWTCYDVNRCKCVSAGPDDPA